MCWEVRHNHPAHERREGGREEGTSLCACGMHDSQTWCVAQWTSGRCEGIKGEQRLLHEACPTCWQVHNHPAQSHKGQQRSNRQDSLDAAHMLHSGRNTEPQNCSAAYCNVAVPLSLTASTESEMLQRQSHGCPALSAHCCLARGSGAVLASHL
jgi:hypothetical protein